MSLSVTRTMIGAEILKLRRNRPLMAFALFLSVGVVILLFGYVQIQHASDPARHATAGGMEGFQRTLRALGLLFGGLVAILIGAEAGTADQSSGVFRDLVATGRSRLALFAVRAPAAIVLTWLFVGAAFVLGIIATFAFAGSDPTPSAGLVVQGAAWVALATSVQAVLAVAVGTITGSRALTLTAVIGWQTIVTQLLVETTSLGAAREGLLSVDLSRLLPVGRAFDVPMTIGAAVAILLVWAVVPALVAARRVRTMDA
jgi:Ca2+/Na+ antiporter